jgi:poly(3-hydroxybutyrate) depolymerase
MNLTDASLLGAVGIFASLGLCACSEAPGPAPASVAGSAGAAGAGVTPGGGAGGSAAGGAASQAGASGASVAGSAGTGGVGGGDAGGGGQGSQAGSAPVDPDAPQPSSACGSADEPADGNHELQVGDLARSYVLRKPESYDPTRPWPLLLALHPNGSTSSYWDATSGERAFRPLLADKAILVLPQSRENDMGDPDWRGNVPLDLEYFEALLAELEGSLCIDLRRKYAMGFSGGGSFSGALGCYRTDIAAIAMGGAVSYFEEAACVGKPAVWVTIGDQEAIQSRLDLRDFWRSYAGCEQSGSVVEPATCTAYTCPDVARQVQFCSHPGDHVWPSFGTEASWTFLSRFRRP